MKGYANTRTMVANLKYQIITYKDNEVVAETTVYSLPEMVTRLSILKEKSVSEDYDSTQVKVLNLDKKLVENTWFDYKYCE